jgi:hypothetical protein
MWGRTDSWKGGSTARQTTDTCAAPQIVGEVARLTPHQVARAVPESKCQRQSRHQRHKEGLRRRLRYLFANPRTSSECGSVAYKWKRDTRTDKRGLAGSDSQLGVICRVAWDPASPIFVRFGLESVLFACQEGNRSLASRSWSLAAAEATLEVVTTARKLKNKLLKTNRSELRPTAPNDSVPSRPTIATNKARVSKGYERCAHGTVLSAVLRRTG